MKHLQRSADRRLPFGWGWGVLLGLGTVLLFSRALFNGFVQYDDSDYVFENAHVRAGLGLRGLWWALTTFHAANWHPVTWVSHMVDWQLWGGHAAGHHLTSVLLHSINAVVLFGLLVAATGKVRRSVLVAVLFAIHPLRVESVAWVAERKDLLAAFFVLLALWAYVRWTRSQAPFWTVVAAQVLALMSKPTAITLPAMLLLLDAWPLGRWGEGLWARLREKWLLLPAVIGSAVVTVIAQRAGGALQTLGNVPVGLRLANAVVAYARYLWNTVWPVALAVPIPLELGGLPAWKVVGAAGLLAVITAAAVLLRHRWPALLMGWAWFAVVLVPMIGIVQVGAQAVADRYTYLSQIGLWLAVAFVPWAPTRTALGRIALGVGAAWMAGCAALTVRQLGYWRDTRTLFTHTLQIAPDHNLVAQLALGWEAKQEGNLDEASRRFEAAIGISPRFVEAISDLGTVRVAQGRLPEGLALLEQAHQLQPENVITGRDLAVVLARVGRKPEAIEVYRRMYELEPDHPGVANELGVLLGEAGHRAEAANVLARAVEAESASAAVHFNFGVALARIGRFSEAADQFQRTLELSPAFPGAQQALGHAREDAARTGR